MAFNQHEDDQFGVKAYNPQFEGARVRMDQDSYSMGFGRRELDEAFVELANSVPASRDLLLETASFEEIEDYYNPGTELVERAFVLEALTVDKFSRAEARMNKVVKVLNRHFGWSGPAEQTENEDGSPVQLHAMPARIGEPKKQGGYAYVVAQLPFTDGQIVSVLFHSPEGDKKRITATDSLIAFRWLLNKRDITHVVAPEDGSEIPIATVCARICQLVEKNSARFQRTQKEAMEEQQELDEAKERLDKAVTRRQELLEEVEKLEAGNGRLETEAGEVQADVQRQKTANAELQAKIDALKQQIGNSGQSGVQTGGGDDGTGEGEGQGEGPKAGVMSVQELLQAYPLNSKGFLEIPDKKWKFGGDKYTWARLEGKTVTLNKPARGELSEKFGASIRLFCQRIGLDWDKLEAGRVSVELKGQTREEALAEMVMQELAKIGWELKANGADAMKSIDGTEFIASRLAADKKIEVTTAEDGRHVRVGDVMYRELPNYILGAADDETQAKAVAKNLDEAAQRWAETAAHNARTGMGLKIGETKVYYRSGSRVVSATFRGMVAGGTKVRLVDDDATLARDRTHNASEVFLDPECTKPLSGAAESGGGDEDDFNARFSRETIQELSKLGWKAGGGSATREIEGFTYAVNSIPQQEEFALSVWKDGQPDVIERVGYGVWSDFANGAASAAGQLNSMAEADAEKRANDAKGLPKLGRRVYVKDPLIGGKISAAVYDGLDENGDVMIHMVAVQPGNRRYTLSKSEVFTDAKCTKLLFPEGAGGSGEGGDGGSDAGLHWSNVLEALGRLGWSEATSGDMRLSIGGTTYSAAFGELEGGEAWTITVTKTTNGVAFSDVGELESGEAAKIGAEAAARQIDAMARKDAGAEPAGGGSSERTPAQEIADGLNEILSGAHDAEGSKAVLALLKDLGRRAKEAGVAGELDELLNKTADYLTALMKRTH